jgi:hypothetical protein
MRVALTISVRRRRERHKRFQWKIFQGSDIQQSTTRRKCMPLIDAKLLREDGTVTTVQIPDKPTDVDLIRALGGDPADDDIHLYGNVRGWDIIYRTGTKDKLVLGETPYLTYDRPRQPCHLDDGQVTKLVEYFDAAWSTLGL